MKEMLKNGSQTKISQSPVIEVKMDSFKLSSICDFANDFDNNKWALKALASLIVNADLVDFSSERLRDGNEYRCGLQQLIEMCVDRQEQQVSELQEMATNSPEYILESAKKMKELIYNNAFSNPGSNRRVMDTVEAVDNIITLFGTEEYPEAAIIRDQILNKIAKPADININQFVANGTEG